MRRLRARVPGFLRLILFLIPLCAGLASCASLSPVGERGVVVAVWDLDDLTPGPAQESLGELFAVQVMDVLRQKPGYTVVERSRLLLVLEELRLGSSLLVDEGTRMRLGRLVGARMMVLGGYQALGGQTRVDLRVVEIETGRVVKAVQKTAPAAGVTEMIDLVRRAAEQLMLSAGAS